MFHPNYPNLELLEYKVKIALNDSVPFKEKYLDVDARTERSAYIDFDVQMFPQIWGSTCTGFDICPDGSPAIGGAAMTKEYTTVFHELCTDSYVICFGNKPCYLVTDPTEAFFSDLKEQHMASHSEAKKIY